MLISTRRKNREKKELWQTRLVFATAPAFLDFCLGGTAVVAGGYFEIVERPVISLGICTAPKKTLKDFARVLLVPGVGTAECVFSVADIADSRSSQEDERHPHDAADASDHQKIVVEACDAMVATLDEDDSMKPKNSVGAGIKHRFHRPRKPQTPDVIDIANTAFKQLRKKTRSKMAVTAILDTGASKSA